MEIQRLKTRIERNGINTETFLAQANYRQDEDKMIRLEAQNDFLNKERLMLEEKIKAMEEENRTKTALRAEINALREQNVVLKDKIHDYEQLMEQNVQKLERVKNIRLKDLQNYEENEKLRLSELAELEEKLDGLEALVATLTAEKGMLEKKV